GTHHCPKCNSSIKPQSAENITSMVMEPVGKTLVFLAPIIRGVKGTHEQVIEDLRKQGFTKIRIDQKIYSSDTVREEAKLARYEKHWIEAVIDSVKIDEEERSRIAEAVEQALLVGKGKMIVIASRGGSKDQKKELDRFADEIAYSTFGACPNHPEIVFESLEPRMFSFNSPFGACPTCHGLGEITEISVDLLIPDRTKSVMDGAIEVYGKMEL
ncbi:MAG: excinuclease ABC subunit UvrA, partial [Candidatus Micrarchaeota archaeon]|nr:excinuclease ABC subunit UvrA [Candidatus Micrarchaeota archaeon]